MPGQKLTPEIPNARSCTSVPTFIRELPPPVLVGLWDYLTLFSAKILEHSWYEGTQLSKNLFIFISEKLQVQRRCELLLYLKSTKRDCQTIFERFSRIQF